MGLGLRLRVQGWGLGFGFRVEDKSSYGLCLEAKWVFAFRLNPIERRKRQQLLMQVHAPQAPGSVRCL